MLMGSRPIPLRRRHKPQRDRMKKRQRYLIISKHVGGAFQGDFYYPGEWVRTVDFVRALTRYGDITLMTPRPAPQHRERLWNETGRALHALRVRHCFAPTYFQLGPQGRSFRLRFFFKELQLLARNRYDLLIYMQFGPSLLHCLPWRPPLVSCSNYGTVCYEGQDRDTRAKSTWSQQNASAARLAIETKMFAWLWRRWGLQTVPQMCRHSDAVILWHPGAYHQLRQALPDAHNLHYIPKGIDLSACAAAPAASPLYDVLFMGAIMERKGIRFLLEAFRTVNREMPPARLAIAGSGPKDMVDDLHRLIEENHVNAVYLGSVPLPERWQLFAQSAIFCLPSLCDTYPLVNLEAMASGLPVITTDAVETRVQDGISGYIVPARDADALAAALLRLLRDEELRKRMGRQARSAALAYDWNRIVDRMMQEVLLPLMRGRNSGRAGG